MMRIVCICDRCGQEYSGEDVAQRRVGFIKEHDNFRRMSEASAVVSFWDMQKKIKEPYKLDFCPKCMYEFLIWFDRKESEE